MEIYRKKQGEPDSAYVLVTGVDDKNETDSQLEPNTTYIYKKVRPGKPDQFATGKTLPNPGLYVQSLYVN